MKHHFKYILLLLLLISNSCNKQKGIVYEKIKIGNEVFINKKTFDKMGNLIIDEVLNKDSIKDGYYKELEGGEVTCIGTYKLGEKEGKWFYMDLAGDTIKIENWLKGKKFGEQIEYFIPMHRKRYHNMYKYAFVNLEGNELFKMIYNTEGQIADLTGSPLYCAYNNDNIERNHSFELLCFIGVPQQFYFNLNITEINLKNNLIVSYKEFDSKKISTELKNLDFGKKIRIEKKYFVPGKYDWKIKLKLTNLLDKKVLVNDSTSINLIVR